MPALLHAQEIVCHTAFDDGSTRTSPDLRAFEVAVNMLRNDALKLLAKVDIRPAPQDILPFETAASALDDLRGKLVEMNAHSEPATQAQELLNHIKEHTIPLINKAVDCFRAIFIGEVMTRQKLQAEQAASAIAGLDKISKQIFFISINASIEAVRAGEAGRGFTQISMDIRALSQSAQQATYNLSNLVEHSG